MNPVKALEQHGQAVWLDFLARGFIAKGDLKKLIDDDGVKGVTSNPSIFEKAIGSSDEYDGAIGAALKTGRPLGRRTVRSARGRGHPARRRRAAPGLRPARRPRRLRQPRSLALSGARHQGDHRRGRAAVERGRARQPDDQGAGHAAGSAGDQASDLQGHQRQRHAAVLAEGLRRGRRGLSGRSRSAVASGGDPSQVASVASFFVSRIDSAVDKELDDKIAKANDPDREGAARSAEGQGRDRQRQARLSGLQASCSPATAGRSWKPRRQAAAAAVGLAPAPRTRPTATCSTSRS